jgi:hypothetical protein
MLKLMRLLGPTRSPWRRSSWWVFFQSMGDLYLPNLMSDIVTWHHERDIDYIVRTGL